MFEDIVIFELLHSSFQNKNEFCIPHEIVVGNSRQGGLLITMLFNEEHNRKKQYNSVDAEPPLQIFAELIDNNDIEYKEKYDVQTGVRITIQENGEIYKMIIGSNGDNFFYFTSLPAINNSTSYGDTIFLNFNHPVESFTFNTDEAERVFK